MKKSDLLSSLRALAPSLPCSNVHGVVFRKHGRKNTNKQWLKQPVSLPAKQMGSAAQNSTE